MITNRQRYEARHAQICQRVEKQYLDQKRKMPTFNVRQAIASYSLAIRAAIVRKDNTGIAACYAIASAHLAIKFEAQKKPSGGARKRKKQLAQKNLSPMGDRPTHESQVRPTQSSLPTFRPHDLGA